MDELDCTYKQGSLPECAPLALSYTPMQAEAKPKYDAAQALSRGTLFPGLDLPFMNIVNKLNRDKTPLGEMQALHFVCYELKLYLDTHQNDKEAFAALRSMLKLTEEAHRRYVELFGPVNENDLLTQESYTWVSDPWPWNYKA